MQTNPNEPDAGQTVTARQWFGLTTVYLAVPLILLACGGDPYWWQAWVFSVLIFAAGIGGRVWAERGGIPG